VGHAEQRGPPAAAAGRRATLEDFRALLADHADYPHGICCHPDPDEHPLEQGATIASVLMDLTARRLWLAAGNPCQTPYAELDLRWLSAPARAAATAV
jgi:isopenicillin-N N-acyltransferase-like protein